ncbi:MAG: molybdopterin biosynthesis protein [Rhodobacteraceae bacterium]|jgi:molybdenum cofactor cytidylyltransferase|uniref:Molybdenum cofactor cytidylyltransferase n=1 Tax=Salipiger profundus TaxID=1229727 RepID=A0A1U7DAX2_9RHOB|nr:MULTISPECIES: molybdopterin-binding protein [Salipiger]APX25226.1 molybdenum cofactor cytidylyltransferase [Salipiger profundus]MAB05561.1 molybdopterin biosynthesis protein [Paracoccaceae bacterium]GGA16203.1 molybdopterin biosynthesis protein [Salipiger profundus]SFD07621.1 molybdenum cofactor cytidylyltransferase [Salipiger profundus]
MKFGPVPLKDAVGGVLAHSLQLPSGRLRKGLIIAPEHLDQLAAAELDEIVVARLEPGDLAEDAAAERLARALLPEPEAAGLRIGRAATGRVNLHATGTGVLEVDAARIDAVNAIHPMITVATLRPYQAVAARSMAATIKIISYAVPGEALDAACAEAGGALRLRPVRARTATLIETTIGKPPSPKGHRAMRGRLQRMGVELGDPVVVPHETAPLAAAIGNATSDVVLVLTGSATSDLHDTAPEALRAAGGHVTHFGMPVDPGNLLFFGALGARPVIGLPGCARSPALNGADWVLERILCGVEVTPGDIMGMGVGGLLKEPPSRPRPREG